MQKPVAAPFRDAQHLAGSIQHANAVSCPNRERRRQVLRRQRVAVPRPSQPFLGQADGRQVRQERVQRDQPLARALTSRFQDVQRGGALDAESPDPRPPQRFEMPAAAEHLADVVGEGADVETCARHDAKA